jgi:hypothetical protein
VNTHSSFFARCFDTSTCRLCVTQNAATQDSSAAASEGAAAPEEDKGGEEDAANGESVHVDAEEAKRRIAAAKAKAKPKMSAAATALAEAKARATKGKKSTDKTRYNQAPKG